MLQVHLDCRQGRLQPIHVTDLVTYLDRVGMAYSRTKKRTPIDFSPSVGKVVCPRIASGVEEGWRLEVERRKEGEGREGKVGREGPSLGTYPSTAGRGHL